MPKIDQKPVAERVAFGKTAEERVLKCLNEQYSEHGYNLWPGTFIEDTKEKTDCWQRTGSGKWLRSAIKARASKDDILVAIRDPFYGHENSKTKIGRDVLYEYFQYITLSRNGKTIRVAKGSKIHEISLGVWDEFLQVYPDFKVQKYNKQKSAHLLTSEKYAKKIEDKTISVELWLHHDAYDWHPKLLAFIPPKLLRENQEIKYHELMGENE